MKKVLFLIIVLAVALRVLWLGSIPSGFFRDEAAIGYNIYSVLKTGMDEFGMKTPLVFRSFEVFFLPLYFYLSVPIVWLLGLTEFSTRFLSSVSGIIAVYVAYLIAKEIWNEKVGLISSFLVAIVPWHIFYSRGTFEGNLALTLFSLGFYFWLKFEKKYDVKQFFISGTFFALSMYSYQAERVVVLLFALLIVLTNYKKLWEVKSKLVLPIVGLVIILIPLLSLSFKPGGYHRAFGVSIFSKQNIPGWIEGEKPGFIINNKSYLLTKDISSLYFSYFSPRNLFTDGDYDKQRSVENFSVFYPFMFIGLVLGLFWIAKNFQRYEQLLIFWIITAPIPAALTGDPFHTYRSLLLYLPLTLIIGYGFSKLLTKNLYKALFIIVCFISLSVFLFNYRYVTQVTRSHDWDYGYKEMIEFVNTLPKETKVVVDDPWTQAYIHFLFFKKVDPTIYHAEVKRFGDLSNYYYSSSERIRPNSFENYEFRRVDWPSERGDSGRVFVMWYERLPESEFVNDPKVKLLKVIYYPDGKPAFRIVQIL